ncbi:MAG: TlpA family protein disulfide reductase [Lewinellaceae bacterium]|nr:TlpA family protein disulfide reductase [Lewinellaceae bacterium]
MQNSQDAVNKPAPDFEVKDINGTVYKLSQLKDKTIVLNFWFTSCKPCIAEIPVLNELVDENKDVVFLALAADKEDRIQSFLKKHSFHYNIVADALKIAKVIM